MEEDAQLLAQAGSLSQGLLADGGGGSLRSFTFSIDLRHFAAGPRLPLNLASVVLELELPGELAGLIQRSNARLPPRLSPLRTSPVGVARGSEVALPGGRAAVDFAAGLMSVATLLARNPVLTISLYHRQRLAEDLLLGRAHVPLAPLLQESWVDGRAGVFALVPSAADPSRHERVQVGAVHLVMSLEEAGPAPVPVAAAAAPAGQLAGEAVDPPAAASASGDGAAAAGGGELDAPPAPRSRPASAGVAGRAAASSAAEAAASHQRQQPSPAASAAQSQAQQQQSLGAADTLAHAPPSRQQAATQPAAMPPGAAAAPASSGGFGVAELDAAWELELWKREEEARWRRDLQEREGKRMAALEEAWRRREAERDAEAASLRSEYSALEAKARQVLAAAEEREQRVVSAEEAVARRRRELEREHAGRVAEAEAAVRRLQAECQHQLEIEQGRREALAQQKAAAEQRAAAAEARAAAADKALQQHREQHSRSEAGRVEAELSSVREQLEATEGRAARAAEAKRKYKEQVVLLAQEVASLQQQLAELAGTKRRQLDAELAQLQAQEQALAARRDAAEMASLKQQLHMLQMGAGGGACSADRSVAAGGDAAGGGKENSGVQTQGAASSQSAGGRPNVLQGQLCEAVQRLMSERELLLGSGAYAADDPLISQLDRRIRECAALAAGGPAAGRGAAGGAVV